VARDELRDAARGDPLLLPVHGAAVAAKLRPLLVIHGDRDPRAVAAQRQWAASVPDGRLLLVPGAGKAVSADRPDLFYPAVEAFLGGEWPARAEVVARALAR
jgi:pimeloyl-ACP methyl ester carboxylesterase